VREIGENGVVKTSGNPIDSTIIDSFMQASKRVKAVENGTSVKSLPMHYSDLEKIDLWIDSTSMMSTLEKVKYKCISALCFYCWFRINEALDLRFSDLQLDIVHQEDNEYRFAKVILSKRKTNQMDPDICDVYEIHDMELEPALKALTKLKNWIASYRENKSTDFRPTEYLFPKMTKIGSNLSFSPAEKTSTQTLNQVLEMVVTGAGLIGPTITGQYTSHCFRRGGAQHRFFYAREKWSLTAVKAWGGWSQKEKTTTLINYILNEYEAKEAYFGDLCSPFKRDRNLSVLDQVPSEPDLANSMTVLAQKIDMISFNLGAVSNAVAQISQAVSNIDGAPAEDNPIQRITPNQNQDNFESEPIVREKVFPSCKSWRDALCRHCDFIDVVIERTDRINRINPLYVECKKDLIIY
jgi:hypothetical protein